MGGEAIGPEHQAGLGERIEEAAAKEILDDITVKELVEECEVNRQTFYYHFQDIYDLLRWFLEHETSEALRGRIVGRTPCGPPSVMCRTTIWPSITYTAPADGTTWTATFSAWPVPSPPPLWRRVHGTCLPERELDFLADFYMYAIAGMMMGWLSDDMEGGAGGDRGPA